LNQEERKEVLDKVRLSLLKTLNLDLLNNSYREISDDNSQGVEFMGISNDQLFAFRVYENNKSCAAVTVYSCNFYLVLGS
jgi:hypothetical protein